MTGIKQKLQILCCPECGSVRLWRDGLRYTEGGPVQRWLCRECGYRFSERHNNFSTRQGKTRDCRVGVPGSNPGSKNSVGALRALKELEKDLTKGQREPTETNLKEKLFEFAWWLKKQGYTDGTVKQRVNALKTLAKNCANLMDPESIKHLLAKRDDWGNNYKHNLVSSYQKFIEMTGLTWNPPHYKPVEKLPFIPLEEEIDALISGCGGKVAATLQLLKETGMRIGEAWKLKWTDIDAKNNTIKCEPEKGSKPRMFKVSSRLIKMLNQLPKQNEWVFGGTSLASHRTNFTRQRKRIAQKLQNPRLEKITFHTLRHWKATIEYHKTKDILHVKQLLGHRSINSTLIYTHLVNFQEPEEFTCRAAKTVEEAKDLIEAGFEYVTEMEGIKLFRKRK